MRLLGFQLRQRYAQSVDYGQAGEGNRVDISGTSGSTNHRSNPIGMHTTEHERDRWTGRQTDS